MKKASQPKLIAFFTASFSLLLCSTVHTQATVRGAVLLSPNSPAANASIALLRSTDSSLVKTGLCNQDGSYVFTDIAKGAYFLSISNTGYQTHFSESIFVTADKPDVRLATIILQEESAALKQITVTAKKPLLEQKIDRLVINVAASITSSGNTALEVLERSPGVVVDRQNNAISLSGKNGVVIMMNGKITHMPVTAVVQMLAGMSAGNIEKIELITTPPASLDAEGNAGYINIVLKENNNYGTNGSFSLSAGYGRGWVTAGSLNINHRKGRFNFYGDVSYARVKTPHPINAYSKISNGGTITESIFSAARTDTVPNVNARLGVDWQVSKQTVIGILLSGYDNPYSQTEHNLNSIVVNGALDTLVHLDNSEKNHWYNYGANLNLQHDFARNGKLLLNADYFRYNNNQPVAYHSTYYDKTNTFIYEQYFKSTKQTPIDFWIAAADFSKGIGKKLTMETGLKQTVSKFNNSVGFERLQGGVWQKDPSLSATYKLREDYSAAYVSFNLTVNKSTDAKAGLRYEFTSTNLNTATQKNIVDRHYGRLFPSFFISHKLSENNAINFSYSRRLTRPSFKDLAPFTYYANANTLVTGNPALQAATSDNFKSAYTFKKYLFSVSYAAEKDAIAGFQPHTDSVQNKTVISAENIIILKTASFLLAVPVNVTPWWMAQCNASAGWQQARAIYQKQPVQVSQVFFSINLVQRFSLPKDFSFELSGNYESGRLFGIQRFKPSGMLDAGLRKKLPGKAGSLTFNFTNILNTAFFAADVNLPEQNLVNNIKIYYARPALKLTYSRSFGKEKLKEKRERNTGAEEEKGRVQ